MVTHVSRALSALAILGSLLLSACSAEPPPAPQTAGRAGPAAQLVALAALPALAAQAEDEPEVAPEPAPVWVATHAITMLWDGPDPDAASLGRLPVGSYFLVIGDPRNQRLPVRYLGSSRIPAQDGWVELAAIGPTREPSADWVEPEFPPRNLVLGQRGEVVRGDPALPLIALTFDAGAGSGSVIELLDVLKGRNVRATFFVAGAFADRYPDVVRRMAADGHELANHSYSHPDFRNLSEQQMRVETRRGTASIETAAGVTIAPLWRPPFGSRNDQILRVMQEEGFRSIYWTFDSGDWLETATTDRVRTTDLTRAVNGAVVVHHVSPLATARAMPDIIDELRRRGYELVTVSEIIGP
jgi:peptidoglycan/xylan/chitin deacetylase (PgdA/CDA1 family)